MSYIENLFSVKGKVILITGASRGIGLSLSNSFKQAGSVVLGSARNKPKIDNDIFDDFYEQDISDEDSILKMIGNIKNKNKKIDVLINNAAISIDGYSMDTWDKTYDINIRAIFFLIKNVLPHMIDNGGGSIINITSINSVLAFPDNPAYISAKGALKQLTKAIAYDNGKYNIRANNIAPGYVKTDMTQKSYNDYNKFIDRKKRTVLDRWGNVEDISGAAIFLASDASSYVTGQDLYIDGGWTIKGL